jgi:Flp pilus assembly pilin Flp
MEIKRGQSTWEYAVVIVLASLAFIAMSTYFRRGVQARLKDLADSQISSVQYVSGQTKSSTTTSSKASQQVQIEKNVRTTTSTEEISRSSTEYSTGEGWEDLLP